MERDKKQLIDVLLQLDFSLQQAQTYLALLELDAVSIRKVADHSGINRGTTYDAIKQLVVRGLVNVRRKGQREYYSAESPERIYDIIRDKRKDLWQTQQVSRAIIPSLMVQKLGPQGRPVVKYYEDDEGIVAILRDVLQTCRGLRSPEYCVYSSLPLRQYIYRKFPTFTERRISEGIQVKVIAIGEGGEVAAASERKWLQEPSYSSAASYTIIYGNKVAVIAISDDNTPYGVVIDDVGAADMQRLLFTQLWKSL